MSKISFLVYCKRGGGLEVVEVVAQKRGHYSLFAKMSIHRHANERERARERAYCPYIGGGRKTER